MSGDPDRQDERQMSTDRDTIRGWADRHEAVPVRHRSTEEGTERLRLVPESRVADSHERLEWDVFHDEVEDEGYVVFYRGETADEPFEVTHRDEAVTRSDLDREQLEERLLGGETVTSEITETTVVESVVVEEATVESELVGSELVDQQVVDVELLSRECTNCELVADRDDDLAEWFDTDRYLGSLGGERGGVGMREETAETATPGADAGAAGTDVDATDVKREFPYHAELDVEEAWMVTRESTERFTVESRIADTEVTEADTIEDHDIDVGGLQRSIVEQGLLDVEHAPDHVMREYEVETEFAEGDRIHTHFERTRVVEDDVVDRMRVRADVTSADLTQMEIAHEEDVASEITGDPGLASAGAEAGGAGGRMGRVELADDEVGKTVVDENGDEVGMVTTVEADEGTMYVDAHPSITERIKAALDWGDASAEDYPVRADQIESVEGDEIRLKGREELSGADQTEHSDQD